MRPAGVFRRPRERRQRQKRAEKKKNFLPSPSFAPVLGSLQVQYYSTYSYSDEREGQACLLARPAFVPLLGARAQASSFVSFATDNTSEASEVRARGIPPCPLRTATANFTQLLVREERKAARFLSLASPSPSACLLPCLNTHTSQQLLARGVTPFPAMEPVPIPLLLLLFFSFPLAPAPASGLLSPKGVNYEVQALMTIKSCLKDPHGVLKNWDQDSVDPCSWTMVTCSQENLVTGLEAPSQNLSGLLSPSIGNLTNLEIVLLQNNNINGRIPAEIGRLTRLRTLDLSSNRFSGEIPGSIGRLRDLQYLRLNNNTLSGAFPSSSANLSRLVFLDLSYNNLSGPVPGSLARTFNIVGNPLICGAATEQDCYGTLPMPMSYSLNNTQGTVMPAKSKSHKAAIAFGSAIGCISVLFLVTGLLFWWRHKKNRQIRFDVDDQHIENVNLENLKRFQFRELQAATENFSSKNMIGKGGFGNVYRGKLPDGTIVAVKRLKDGNAAGGELQFQTEVEMISLAVHRNLLRLCGFCMTATERLLIYPYMSNGSVASRLKGKPPLNWITRKGIALGAARGLLYLHEQCDPKIIHRDVKAANVLLDDFCEAIVGDFGLAKLLDHRDSHVTTAVRGTVGHIAPEYLSTGQSSEKTDVFGFGILLLELITGQTALEFGKSSNQKGAMLDWVKKMHQEKKLDVLVDKGLGSSYDHIELEEMVQVALLCTQYLPGHRPKMSEVVRMLEGDGLAERWEASQRTDSHKFKVPDFTFGRCYSDLTDDSSLLVQAVELSGPR